MYVRGIVRQEEPPLWCQGPHRHQAPVRQCLSVALAELLLRDRGNIVEGDATTNEYHLACERRCRYDMPSSTCCIREGRFGLAVQLSPFTLGDVSIGKASERTQMLH